MVTIRTKVLAIKRYGNQDQNLVFDCDDSRNPDARRKVEWYLPNLIGMIYHDYDEATIASNWGNDQQSNF